MATDSPLLVYSQVFFSPVGLKVGGLRVSGSGFGFQVSGLGFRV